MLNILQKEISILTADSTLAGLMNTTTPNSRIFTGPVDVVKETQGSLGFPLLTLIGTSESFRTVPQGARDSRIQIDIWSRNSELEVENIYERVQTLLNFQSGDTGTSHVFWQRSGGSSSEYETDVRLWRWSTDFVIWSI